MSIHFITGGVRSGKSAFAEELALKCGDQNVLYIATGVKTDVSMNERIKKHQEQRPTEWGLLEESMDLNETISSYKNYNAILIDCLSTLVTNWLIITPEENIPNHQLSLSLKESLLKWIEHINDMEVEIIVVSSEVGLGGVAMSPLGRWFQDLLGELNQLVAQKADTVHTVISGIPLRLKP